MYLLVVDLFWLSWLEVHEQVFERSVICATYWVTWSILVTACLEELQQVGICP